MYCYCIFYIHSILLQTQTTILYTGKYTYKMTIPNKLIKKWHSELIEYGVLKSAEEMDLNYRTLRDAIKKGECTQKTFDIVNAFLLKKREENKAITVKVLNVEDQD